ncbi:MAG: hypothetical protein A2Y07_10505 [Planctomycetes bacterium GWF2_50_10]|nr:MAG: hypothetical protein A2Y07_10505 [Planctomycetes bacterium GWF2_50_10]
MTTTTLNKKSQALDSVVLFGDYSDLLSEYELRPIHNSKQYKKALYIADKFVGRNDLTRDQLDFLETLTMLINYYEECRFPVASKGLAPLDIVRHLVEANGLNASDLGRILGQRELGSKILKGERQLSKNHIRQIADYFSVDPGLLL